MPWLGVHNPARTSSYDRSQIDKVDLSAYNARGIQLLIPGLACRRPSSLRLSTVQTYCFSDFDHSTSTTRGSIAYCGRVIEDATTNQRVLKLAEHPKSIEAVTQVQCINKTVTSSEAAVPGGQQLYCV
jgi:hypothetical protein